MDLCRVRREGICGIVVQRAEGKGLSRGASGEENVLMRIDDGKRLQTMTAAYSYEVVIRAARELADLIQRSSPGTVKVRDEVREKAEEVDPEKVLKRSGVMFERGNGWLKIRVRSFIGAMARDAMERSYLVSVPSMRSLGMVLLWGMGVGGVLFGLPGGGAWEWRMWGAFCRGVCGWCIGCVCG